MLIISLSLPTIDATKAKLAHRYEMTDLGEARWILNMKIIQDRPSRSIQLSQERYIEDILERQGMADCRPISTPMAQNQKLVKLMEAEIDPTPYQRAVGSLMYAMLGTRPDLAYSIGTLSQHSATPGNDHWAALQRVYRYLRGTSQLKLTFRGGSSSTTKPIGYADADWASDINDRRSISGYTYIIGGGAICWPSKKQHSTALSSTEAEYMAACNATKEAVWLRSFLQELKEKDDSPMTILIDN